MYCRTSGLFNRYDMGNEHRLIGRSAPDFRFENGCRLGDLLHEAEGVALDFTADRALQGAAREWDGRIRYAAGRVRNALGLAGVLVRPDGVVAWASDTPDREAFRRAAARWFAAPDR